MGVRRAVDLTLDLVNHQEQKISTYGPLIHNPQVLDVLEDKGVGVYKDIPEEGTGTIIIRAHGIPPVEKEGLSLAGFEVKDATCPRVHKVQAIITKHKKDGRKTIIIGDRNHAEVEGLMGYAGDECQVVSSVEEVEKLQINKPYIIVSQTTQDQAVFEKITNKITSLFSDGLVFNTICDSTHLRQAEVKNLCTQVEAVVVVGGNNSANTTRLADIASGLGKPVFLIESESELNAGELSQYDKVGITAGASTPSWMINRVVRALEAIPGKSEGVAKPLLFRGMRLLMVSNFYVSFAGALLTFACAALQGIEPQFEHAAVTFGYLFAMHNINRLTNQKAKIFNDPMYLLFFQKYKNILLVLSTITLMTALLMVFLNDMKPFLLLLVMSVFGLLYSINFIPQFVAEKIKVRRLKEIPGSKTLFVALAWAMVVTVLTALSSGIGINKMTLGSFIFVLMLVFVRNVLFDVFEVQGDRIVGKETLPVVIGSQKTISLLNVIMAGLFVILIIFPAVGLMASPVSYWALPGVIYLMVFMLLYRQGFFSPGVRLEFGLETTFVILFLTLTAGAKLL